MKKPIVVGMFLAVLFLGFAACEQFKTRPKKWEYTWKYLNMPSEEAQLNQLGADGWELVAVNVSQTPAPKGFDVFYVFKRPLSQ